MVKKTFCEWMVLGLGLVFVILMVSCVPIESDSQDSNGVFLVVSMTGDCVHDARLFERDNSVIFGPKVSMLKITDLRTREEIHLGNLQLIREARQPEIDAYLNSDRTPGDAKNLMVLRIIENGDLPPGSLCSPFS